MTHAANGQAVAPEDWRTALKLHQHAPKEPEPPPAPPIPEPEAGGLDRKLLARLLAAADRVGMPEVARRAKLSASTVYRAAEGKKVHPATRTTLAAFLDKLEAPPPAPAPAPPPPAPEPPPLAAAGDGGASYVRRMEAVRRAAPPHVARALGEAGDLVAMAALCLRSHGLEPDARAVVDLARLVFDRTADLEGRPPDE